MLNSLALDLAFECHGWDGYQQPVTGTVQWWHGPYFDGSGEAGMQVMPGLFNFDTFPSCEEVLTWLGFPPKK